MWTVQILKFEYILHQLAKSASFMMYIKVDVNSTVVVLLSIISFSRTTTIVHADASNGIFCI